VSVLSWVGRVGVLRILIPIMALTALVVGAGALGPALAASRGEGLPGTVTVTREQCGKGGCQPFGRYVSTDGSVTLPDAHLDGDGAVGDRVSVVYLGESSPAQVHVPGSDLWVLIAVSLVVAGAFIAWWLWDIARAVHRRLRRPSARL